METRNISNIMNTHINNPYAVGMVSESPESARAEFIRKTYPIFSTLNRMLHIFSILRQLKECFWHYIPRILLNCDSLEAAGSGGNS